MLFYRIVMLCLAPCVAYDWFTSFLGAAAIFNISEKSPGYFWGIPIALSFGAVGMNFVTTDVMAKDGGAPGFMRIFWFICLIYDAFTTFIGLTQVKVGEGLFAIRTIDPLVIMKQLTPMEAVAFIVGTMVFVVSPMASWWLWKQPHPVNPIPK
jgi:hypothetical protein